MSKTHNPILCLRSISNTASYIHDLWRNSITCLYSGGNEDKKLCNSSSLRFMLGGSWYHQGPSFPPRRVARNRKFSTAKPEFLNFFMCVMNRLTLTAKRKLPGVDSRQVVKAFCEGRR